MATMLPIAAALEIDPYALVEGRLVKREARLQGSVEVPLFGTIAAGSPIEPSEADDVYPIPAEVAQEHPGSFLLRVSGESMNRELPNGCYALVVPTSVIGNTDEPYVVSIGGDCATVKHVRQLANGIELRPSSSDPTYKPVVYDFDDPTVPDIAIIGRVVWYILPTRWAFGSGQ